jgi:tagaturonate epimerase
VNDNQPALRLEVARRGTLRRLRVSTSTHPRALDDFEGTTHTDGDTIVLDGPLTSINAAAAREWTPWLRPRPVGLVTSFGVGDRLGLATPGHVRAFKNHGGDLVPVFAQQSAREIARLKRSAQAVMDDATFGAIEGQWGRSFGADADHLKTIDDVDAGVSAGFTSFTLDPGDHVRPLTAHTAVKPEDIRWTALEDSANALRARYQGLAVDAAGTVIHMDAERAGRAAYKYGGAVAHTLSLYRRLQASATYPVEVEVAVDETEQPTTLEEHVYLATEMRRLGMTWVGLALRYVGSFQKGIAYVGDLRRLVASVSRHAAIAANLGPYKLSLHSASDKFGLYRPILQATQGMLHVKTSGTSYLEALRVACESAPELFREIYAASRSGYHMARNSYQVSAAQQHIRDAATLRDTQLAELLEHPATRQMLHVGYGELIGPRQTSGNRQFLLDDLRAVLLDAPERYAADLDAHIGRHLQELRSAP